MKYSEYLVTGGLGYIGSNFVYKLLTKCSDARVTILDNQINCKNNDIFLLEEFGERITIKIGEIDDIFNILTDQKFDVVVHLGANAYVGESMKTPHNYFGGNVTSTYQLARYCKSSGVKHVLFSSTCAVYGNFNDEINELTATSPESPYGYSKLFSENVLINELRNSCKLTIFRFFNVAGAEINFKGGEYHVDETHLVPILINKAIMNEEVVIYGDDYPTMDGSCLREYVHVSDIVHAHLLAISKSKEGVFNLGSSKPISNFEVLKKVETVLNTKIKFYVTDKRVGDAVSLRSSYSKAFAELGWYPKNSEIKNIIQSYVDWLGVK